MPELRLLLADDHTLVRHGLRKILEGRPEWEVISEVGDGRSAVKLALEHRPDVVLLDIGMPQLNGIEVTRQILRRLPSAGVLIVSMHAEDAYVTQALKAGVRGYLLKDSAGAELLQAVEAVAAGDSYFSPTVANVMLRDYVEGKARTPDRYDALSEREVEILQLVAEGHSSREIGEMLSVSPSTVDTHRTHILHKLDLHSTAELILYAVRRGVIA
jgi:DNA-binding NarL/FixJ family response regulator